MIEFIKNDAPLSGEIKGIDLNSKITLETSNKIINFVDENLVVLIRNQSIDDNKLKDFSKLFGELDPPAPNPYGINFLPEHPEINVISNVKNHDGKPIGTLGDGEATWHADMTYLESPPKFGILYAIEVPENQGNTHFANMHRAYERLPNHLKKKINDKIIIHDSSHNSAGMLRKGYEEVDSPDKTPGARHPAVITNLENNQKRLFLGRRPNAYILGMTVKESEKLLDEVWHFATNDEITWTQKWKVGDLLIWKNLYVLHKRDAFDPNSRRIMHRTQIKGNLNLN